MLDNQYEMSCSCQAQFKKRFFSIGGFKANPALPTPSARLLNMPPS